MTTNEKADPHVQLVRDEMNRLRGWMFEAVEAADLPEKQEKALKGLIRQSTYVAQTNMEAALRTNHHRKET